MANNTAITGGISEMTAAAALMRSGFIVSRPIIAEAHDFIAYDPKEHRFLRMQVKTVYERKQRNALVVYARKQDGSAYTPEEADYIVAVHGPDVYLIENTGQREYWATPGSVAERWRKL